MLRIAVLGCGRIGRMHAANIARHPRAKLATVFDTHRSFAKEVAAQNGVNPAISVESVFESADVSLQGNCTRVVSTSCRRVRT